MCRDVERGERKRNEIGVVVDLRLGGDRVGGGGDVLEEGC